MNGQLIGIISLLQLTSAKVLSKLSNKHALPGNRITKPHLELGYNKCDNPDCKYRNSLQAAKGRYKCKGFLPKPGIGSQSKSELPRRRHGTAGDESDKSDDNGGGGSVRRERCPGTYHVSSDHAYYAAHLFRMSNRGHCKRADWERGKATRKAAREARSRAVKLAGEVERELNRELVLREKESVRMGREGPSGEKNTDEIQQPVKRLKREIRRLPMIIRTAVPSNADAPSSPPPASPKPPALRRRNVSDNPPRPRPVAVFLEKFSLASPCLPQTAPVSRAQYPVVSRPAFSARNRSASMNDVNDRATDQTQEQKEDSDSPFRLRRRVTYAQARWVSYKNGLVITHLGALVPTNRVCISPLLNTRRS
ncbi:hypothetical protein APHAL10511_007692 [Amanita phalloides]|nr:hypothetical protein APHAL10511_007692 [Amanita phalloides]